MKMIELEKQEENLNSMLLNTRSLERLLQELVYRKEDLVLEKQLISIRHELKRRLEDTRRGIRQLKEIQREHPEVEDAVDIMQLKYCQSI